MIVLFITRRSTHNSLAVVPYLTTSHVKDSRIWKVCLNSRAKCLPIVLGVRVLLLHQPCICSLTAAPPLELKECQTHLHLHTK